MFAKNHELARKKIRRRQPFQPEAAGRGSRQWDSSENEGRARAARGLTTWFKRGSTHIYAETLDGRSGQESPTGRLGVLGGVGSYGDDSHSRNRRSRRLQRRGPTHWNRNRRLSNDFELGLA